MEFSRQEYWWGLPFPSPGGLPDPGIEPRSSTLQADALPSEPPGKPLVAVKGSLIASSFQCKETSRLRLSPIGQDHKRAVSSGDSAGVLFVQQSGEL